MNGSRGILAIPASILIAVNASSAAGQSIPKFEAVSIRRCSPGNGRSPNGGAGFAVPASSPGRLSTCSRLAGELEPPPAAPFEGLIEDAYGKFANGRMNPPWAIPKVEGGPAWLRSDLYGVNATAEGAISEEMMRGPMMQALLEDRFKLRLHRETREAPVYQLVVSKGGPKLRPFQQGSCVPVDSTRILQGRLPSPPQGKWCDSGTTGLGTIHVFGRGITIQAAAYLLSLNLDRPVIDKTGLAGLYDLDVEFARDPSLAGPPPPPPPSPGALPAEPRDQPSGPSVFTAVQEQLGLRLESAKGPVEILVIDHVERPSEN
jgi:uncharacterized protein (TIGR03435 family)